jgi:hypothetical protein
VSTIANKENLLNTLETIYFRIRATSKENLAVARGIYFLPNLIEMIPAFITDITHIIINGIDAINWSTIDSLEKIIVQRAAKHH